MYVSIVPVQCPVKMPMPLPLINCICIGIYTGHWTGAIGSYI